MTKDRTTAYARAVGRGKIVAGPWVRKACERHLRDQKNQKKLGLTWNAAKAELAIDFYPEMLVLEDGNPFTLLPYQEFIVGSIFGWYNSEGFRRFRDAYVETGKGSGKTPLAAGIGLRGLIADGEPAAEIYSAATSQDQAKIAWTDAERMVTQSPELQEAIKREAACLTYTSPEGVESVFRPVSSEHRALDGKRPHIAIIDELHEHPSGMVVDKMKAGLKRRRNSLIFRITNSGFDRHSVCWNEHEYSIKVLQGVIVNEAWFAYVCAIDEKDSFLNDEKCWPKVNPGMHAGLPPISYLRDQVTNAKGMPSKENIVRRLNGCEWTEQSTRAIPMEEWDRGAQAFNVAELRGRLCFGGLDLARVNDLSALELLFPPIHGDEKWKVLSFFWCPEDDIGKRVQRDRVPYDVWVRQGLIATTPGNTTDYGFIEAKIVELSGIYNIKGIGFDRTFAGEIVQALLAEGVNMVEVGQGFLSMGAPTAELLRRIKAGELQHGGNPVLRWMVSNLACLTDAAGNLKPDKEHSAEKIDGISAYCNAEFLAGREPKDQNVYNDRAARGEAVLRRL